MSIVEFLGPQNAPKSLAAEASPQTHLGEFTVLSQTAKWVWGPTSKIPICNGRTEERIGVEKQGGEEWSMTPTPETFALSLVAAN